MAVIVYKNINMRDLKVQCDAFNESGLLETPLVTKVGAKKQDLADAFVKAIEVCAENEKLDDIPETVYTYYTQIVAPGDPENPPPPEALPPKQKAPKAPKPPKPVKPKRTSRPEAFVKTLVSGEAVSMEEMAKRMNETYVSNAKASEGEFWVRNYNALLIALGLMKKDGFGKDALYTYTG